MRFSTTSWQQVHLSFAEPSPHNLGHKYLYHDKRFIPPHAAFLEFSCHDGEKQTWMYFFLSKESLLVMWQQVKYMHSKSQSYCGPNKGHPQALMRATAMLYRLKSLLSHSGECLWLSLERSSQGWREAVRERWRAKRGAGEVGLQAFVFLTASLWRSWKSEKGKKSKTQAQRRMLATPWQNQCLDDFTGWCRWTEMYFRFKLV